MPRLLQIAKLGHHVLREIASPVQDVQDPGVKDLLADMVATMEASGGIGLAAPQVHVSSRIFVFSSRPSPRYPAAPEIPTTVVINPEVVSQSSDLDAGWEGCLSMPGYKGLVERPQQISARWIGQDGKPTQTELHDLAARVFLHELDHLDGVMFLDRMESPHDLIAVEMAGMSTVDARLEAILT